MTHPHRRHSRNRGLERREDAKGGVVGIEGRKAGASGLHPAGAAGAVIDADGPASFLLTAAPATVVAVLLPSRSVTTDPARRATGRGVLVLGGVRAALEFGGEFRIALRINASL
jgi:hypothetical protein